MNPSKFTRGQVQVSRSRNKIKDYAYLLALASILVVPMIVIVSIQSVNVELGYRVIELRDKNEAMREEQTKLKLELARLKSPERVLLDVVALGLRPLPVGSQFDVIRPNTPDPKDPANPASGEPMVAQLERTR